MIEPQQGLSYDDQLAIARRAEAAGFETLFRSDHYDSFPGELGNPSTDAWTVLAGLARETERMERLVERVLTFRQLDRPRTDLSLQPHQPETLVRQALAVAGMSFGCVLDGTVIAYSSPALPSLFKPESAIQINVHWASWIGE